MGWFSCQLIIDSRMPVHDPPGSVSGYRFTIHDHLNGDNFKSECLKICGRSCGGFFLRWGASMWLVGTWG